MKELDDTQEDDNIDDDLPGDEDDAMSIDDTETPADPFDDYMPVQRIVSDREQLKQDEMLRNIYSPPPVVHVKTVPATIYNIPVHLTAYAFDMGDVSSFPSPKKDEYNKLGWIMDYQPIVVLFKITSSLGICIFQETLELWFTSASE